LIVEDEVHARQGLAELIRDWGYRTETAQDGMEGYEKVIAWSPEIVITDLKMPRMDGMEFLMRLADTEVSLAVIVLTAQGSVELAVDAMKLGAYDFLPKPVDAARLKTILTNATRQRETKVEREQTRRQLRQGHTLGALVGQTERMREIFELIERIAGTNVSVLITGESGTGKELIARTLHELSDRKRKPFVAVNCAAIPETLMESEIFGHEKGAFTGAVERRAGCFEMAEGGTLLLDELGEMPIGTQAKLLRVLEERKLRRLGGSAEISVDVRVLAATNRNPDAAVAAGQLRADLLYRLNVFHVQIPPLRERRQDIPLMAEVMLAEMNAKHRRRVAGMTERALRRVQNCEWPGNARELRNAMERAVILAPEDGKIDLEHLPQENAKAEAATGVSVDNESVQLSVGTTVAEAERKLILKTLEAASGNKTRAAQMLAVSLKTLHNKLKEYGQREPDKLDRDNLDRNKEQ
jgi:DNA-binding NtrC family response regulator